MKEFGHQLLDTETADSHSFDAGHNISKQQDGAIPPVWLWKSWLSFYTRDSIFKLLSSPGIDSKESIPRAYVGWARRYDNPILTRFLAPLDC